MKCPLRLLIRGSAVNVGMDVDKEKIAIAVLRGTDPDVTEELVIRNEASSIRKRFAKFKEYGEVMACYEAGSFGFELYRQLTEMEVTCKVVAPGCTDVSASSTQRRSHRDICADQERRECEGLSSNVRGHQDRSEEGQTAATAFSVETEAAIH
jgi:hypothetical protein